MSEQIIVRGSGEGRTLLVAGGDYVTYKARGAETGGDFFSFESSTLPGFGPPMHRHPYRELFTVFEGSYEFTIGDPADHVQTISAPKGTFLAVAPDVPHTFRNTGSDLARLFCVQLHATLEGFFEEFGVPVGKVGEVPADVGPPDFAAMAAAFGRNGVTLVGGPGGDR